MPSSGNQEHPPPTPMSQTNQAQDNTPGGTQGTRSREAALQELVTSAVGTALRPVASRLGELRQQLDPITAHINNNTVTPSALQTHLNPMSQSIQSLQGQLDRIEKRFDPLNDRLNTVQDAVLHNVGQRFGSLEQDAQATHNDVQAIRSDVQAILNDIQATRNNVQTVSTAQIVANELTADAVVSSFQIYNSTCESGSTRPFKIVPFVRQGGGTELPDACNLPLLHDVAAIDSVNDQELDEYLEGYGIDDCDGLSRAAKLRKLRVYIGCTPKDDTPPSHTSSLLFMVLLGAMLFAFFPHHFLSL